MPWHLSKHSLDWKKKKEKKNWKADIKGTGQHCEVCGWVVFRSQTEKLCVLIKSLSCPVFTFAIISVCSFPVPLLLLWMCFLVGKSNRLYYFLCLTNSLLLKLLLEDQALKVWKQLWRKEGKEKPRFWGWGVLWGQPSGQNKRDNNAACVFHFC